jgi:transposase
MTVTSDVNNVCCAALELSKSSWLCSFDAPGSATASIHKIAARDIDGLVNLLRRHCRSEEQKLNRELTVTLCFEAGYDGFWIARMLIARGIDTIVFDPASFLRPRRGRVAKTDRLDAVGMCRTLRTWLSGDRSVASSVQIQSVEEEDAKRIVRERKYLVQQRGRVVSRIKGILALQGIHLANKGIGKALAVRLCNIKTAEGHPIPILARRDVERMLRCHELLSSQIAEVDVERAKLIKSRDTAFPFAEKVDRLTQMAGVGEISAAVLVAEVYHRNFESRRHLASFIGLAPSPYASGDTSRDKGINKAGTKLARQTLVELAWFWLRYQPESLLSKWWKDRFGSGGMRGRKVGIVALARKLAIALWRFVEFGVVPEGATLKAQTET